jgi:hypothetical protein
MCKVTVKKVEKFKKGATGSTNGKPWELHVFQCMIMVDGALPAASRTVKTFEADIAKQLKDLEEGKELTFEAKKEGAVAPFEFMLVPEKRQNGQNVRNRQSEPFGPTNRQAALDYGVKFELARASNEGDSPLVQNALLIGAELLEWLEGGAK